MMNNNDFEYIKDKFDNDGLSAPQSLSESEILTKLYDKPRLRFYQKKGFKAFVSAAACFTLVVGILASALPKSNVVPSDDGVQSSGVAAYESYDELKKELEKAQSYERDTLKGGYDSDISLNPTDGIPETVTTGSMDSSFGETYIQVDGVDEADIIKNDGRYIYYVNEESQIKIYEGERLVSSIDDFCEAEDNGATVKRDFSSTENEWTYICDIYIKDDRLIVNSVTDKRNFDEEGDDYEYTENTSSTIYDVSDPASPKVVDTFSQSGSYSSSRMIGDKLYVISGRMLNVCKRVEDLYVKTSQNGCEETLPADSIYRSPDSAGRYFLIVSVLDIVSGKRCAETKAFCAERCTEYCNQNNLYLAVNKYYHSEANNSTEIIKVLLKDDSIEFAARASVNGYVHNQFSMDEKDGFFRIATTDSTGNNLYVLDSDLKQVGEVTGFAKDETIRAVKYIGNMAYVITYLDTDPLFVIDLSDPASPTIQGSVEITGFSSQLVPVGDNKLLGIGYNDEFDLKLALFDISNPSAPAVLDSYVLENASSNAQYDHKAILVNKQKGYIAMDYNEYVYDGDFDDRAGALVTEVRDGKIIITDKFAAEIDDFPQMSRVTYIGDTIYALDTEGRIYSFNR